MGTCLAGYSPWGRKESNMTEQQSTSTSTRIKSCAAVAADLQYPLRALAFQVENRDEALCDLRE